jgi:hypothetical protein
MTVCIVLIYVCVAILDPYGLLKRGLKRDFMVCSVLYLISFSLAFALSMHWEIPSPSPIIMNLIEGLF